MSYRDAVLRTRPIVYSPLAAGGAGTDLRELIANRAAAVNGAGYDRTLRNPVHEDVRGAYSTGGGGYWGVASDAAINNALLGSHSIAVWIAYTTTGSLMRLLGKASGSFLLAVLVNYRANVAVTNGWVSIYSATSGSDAEALTFDAGAIYDGRPHLFVFTRTGSSDLRAYVDGVLGGSRTPVSNAGSNTGDLAMFGHDNSGNAQRFVGWGGHFALWDRPISHPEVRELYQAGRAGLAVPAGARGRLAA